MPQIQCSHQHLRSICDSTFFICVTQIGDIMQRKTWTTFPSIFFRSEKRRECMSKAAHSDSKNVYLWSQLTC